MTKSSDKKIIRKTVKRGVLLCAPFLLSFAAVLLLSVLGMQYLLASSSVLKAIGVNNAPDSVIITDNTQKKTDEKTAGTDNTHTSLNDVPMDEPYITSENTFPVIFYGNQWATMNVQGWKKTDIPVYFGDEKAFLKKGACMSIYSRYPGKGGRCILSAHVTSYFHEMEDCKVGDEVVLNTVYGTYRYQVCNIFLFQYNDGNILFSPNITDIAGEENLLFLYTCYPRKNGWEFKDQRIAVICRMTEGKDWREQA